MEKIPPAGIQFINISPRVLVYFSTDELHAPVKSQLHLELKKSSVIELPFAKKQMKTFPRCKEKETFRKKGKAGEMEGKSRRVIPAEKQDLPLA